MRTPRLHLFSSGLRTRLNKIRRLFGDSDNRCARMAADLVWKYGCVDYAEALDTEHAEVRVDDAGLGRSANTCGGRLQKLAVSS